MKKIFIYYSFSGNGDILADVYKEKGYEIRKVISKKSLPKAMFFQMMKGGFLASINKKFPLVDFDNDISEFDEVVIGSPIWAGKLACPINTVLSLLDLSKKKLAFVLYSGGGEAPKTVKKLKEKYSCDIIELKEPKKYTEELNKLQ